MLKTIHLQTEIGRGRTDGSVPFWSPERNRKRLRLSPLLLRVFSPTGFNVVHRSRAGSFAADLCAKRTGKSQKITEKQARLFYRKFSGFSYARELSLRLSSYRRKQVLFFRLPHRPLGFQRDEIPLAQGSKRPEKHPLGWFSAESGPEGPGT